MWNSSIFEYFSVCFQLPSTKHNTIAFALVNVLFLLPLCLYILRLGVQRWRSSSKMSHTDFFTYNMVAIQLLTVSGCCLLALNLAFLNELVIKAGILKLSVSYIAVIIFQALTCLERYMAVVHPVTYLRLKSQSWTLIRNISCGLVWLLSLIFASCFCAERDVNIYFYLLFLVLSFCLLVVFFCNIFIFCVLIRPQPGDGTKGNKTKKKALYMNMEITGALLFKFTGDILNVISFLLLNPNDINNLDTSCTIYSSVNWFTLPSMLVLPWLFLQRHGKLDWLKTNKQHQTH